jgi:hypothetical protein
MSDVCKNSNRIGGQKAIRDPVHAVRIRQLFRLRKTRTTAIFGAAIISRSIGLAHVVTPDAWLSTWSGRTLGAYR